jgi:hypothetical protein
MKIFVGAPVLPTVNKPTRDQITEMSDELMLRIAAQMPREMHGYYRDWSRLVAGLLKEVSNVT